MFNITNNFTQQTFADPIVSNWECDWLPNLYKITVDSQLINSALQVCTESKVLSDYQITPMHLAATNKDHSLLNALHEIGLEIDKSDIAGYTPLHHAAMKGDVKGVSTLLSWGANPEHRNGMGGTYADLLRFNEPFRETSDYALNTTLFNAHKKDDVQVDPKCIPHGVTFIHENVVEPYQLVELWKKFSSDRVSKVPLAGIDKSLKSKYAAFKNSPHKLSIEPITHDETGKKINLGDSFCGVIAKSPIKKGDIIAEYTGEMYQGLRGLYGKAADYLWDEWPPVNSKYFRSAASVINHAFPNARLGTLTHSSGFQDNKAIGKEGDGLPNRHVIIAIQDIAEGEQVTIDYGLKYDWNNLKPVELRPKSVIEFIKQNSWTSLFNTLSNFTKNQNLDLMTQLLSLLSSTPNLVALAKEKLISLRDFELIKHYIKIIPDCKTDLKEVEKAIQKN